MKLKFLKISILFFVMFIVAILGIAKTFLLEWIEMIIEKTEDINKLEFNIGICHFIYDAELDFIN